METASCVADRDVEPVLPGECVVGGVDEAAVGVDDDAAVRRIGCGEGQPARVRILGMQLALDRPVDDAVLGRVVVQGGGVVVEEAVDELAQGGRCGRGRCVVGGRGLRCGRGGAVRLGLGRLVEEFGFRIGDLGHLNFRFGFSLRLRRCLGLSLRLRRCLGLSFRFRRRLGYSLSLSLGLRFGLGFRFSLRCFGLGFLRRHAVLLRGRRLRGGRRHARRRRLRRARLRRLRGRQPRPRQHRGADSERERQPADPSDVPAGPGRRPRLPCDG